MSLFQPFIFSISENVTNCFEKPKESTKKDVMLFYSVEMHCLANVHSKIKKGVKWLLQLSVEEASPSVARD